MAEETEFQKDVSEAKVNPVIPTVQLGLEKNYYQELGLQSKY